MPQSFWWILFHNFSLQRRFDNLFPKLIYYLQIDLLHFLSQYKKIYPCRNISSGVLLYYICSAAHLLLLCFDVRPCFNRLLLVLLSLTSIILSGITGSISAPSGNKSCLWGNFTYNNIWSFSAYTIFISFCKTK